MIYLLWSGLGKKESWLNGCALQVQTPGIKDPIEFLEVLDSYDQMINQVDVSFQSDSKNRNTSRRVGLFLAGDNYS